MSIWSVFVTGLVAGGASCAAVQGGLLVGLVARRQPRVEPVNWWLDILPVSGFLLGKLVSHAALGLVLGLVGKAVQPTFRVRGLMQIAAGVVMVMLAADLLGLRGFRQLLPRPPASFARFVRRNAKSQALAAPALLGFATVLIPCGVTLSMFFLAITSANPFEGAAIMAAFVLGTSPLFAVLGYAARRSATVLKGRLSKAAAVMVILAALVSINSGLILSGSRVTLASIGSVFSSDSSDGTDLFALPEAGVGSDGMQEVIIGVQSYAYSPSRIRAKAGVPTRLVLRTNRTRGCTRAFVIPSANFQKVLPETGATAVDLGVLKTGTIHYTCSMGMYRGSIEVV